MNSEELNIIKTIVPNEKDKVIISFNKFNGIDEIHELDIKLYKYIQRKLGGMMDMKLLWMIAMEPFLHMETMQKNCLKQ